MDSSNSPHSEQGKAANDASQCLANETNVVSSSRSYCVESSDEGHKQMKGRFDLICDFDKIFGDIDIPRYFHDHITTMRFPEILLLLLVQAGRQRLTSGGGNLQGKACIAWTDDGRAIIIRNKKELVQKLLPVALCKSQLFSSFTRRLYRWGFRNRKMKSSKAADEMIFFHPLFQRDNKPLMTKMNCVTADGAAGRQSLASQARTTTLQQVKRSDSLANATSCPVEPSPRTSIQTLAADFPTRFQHLHHSVQLKPNTLQTSLAILERERMISLLAAQHLSFPSLPPSNFLPATLGLFCSPTRLTAGFMQPDIRAHLGRAYPRGYDKLALMSVLQQGLDASLPDDALVRQWLRLAGNNNNP